MSGPAGGGARVGARYVGAGLGEAALSSVLQRKGPSRCFARAANGCPERVGRQSELGAPRPRRERPAPPAPRARVRAGAPQLPSSGAVGRVRGSRRQQRSVLARRPGAPPPWGRQAVDPGRGPGLPGKARPRRPAAGSRRELGRRSWREPEPNSHAAGPSLLRGPEAERGPPGLPAVNPAVCR